MDHAGEAAGPCRNCGALPPAHANYCAQCGQETALHPPTFGEFVHEFIGHYIALEGALWRTLGLLLAKPGRLTREYLAGRRKRYVLPLRLYLTISFVFFVAMNLMPTPGTSYRAEDLPPVLQEQLHEDARTIKEQSDRNMARLQRMMPTAMFVLLPVFAAILHLAWRSRQMTYGEHFVFSLHLHSFWFLALLPVRWLPDPFGAFVLVTLPLYAVLAMRAVYGGRWRAVQARFAMICLLYAIALAATFAAMLAWLKFAK